MDNSQHAIICETVVVSVGYDNDVIEHFDIEECSSPFYFLSELFIGLTGLEVSRGVVMGKTNSSRSSLEHHGKEDAQVHYGTRDAPIGHLIDALDPIGVVEQ